MMSPCSTLGGPIPRDPIFMMSSRSGQGSVVGGRPGPTTPGGRCSVGELLSHIEAGMDGGSAASQRRPGSAPAPRRDGGPAVGAGGERNFMRENVRRLRRYQAANKHLAPSGSAGPVKALWRSHKYENVPSKVAPLMRKAPTKLEDTAPTRNAPSASGQAASKSSCNGITGACGDADCFCPKAHPAGNRQGSRTKDDPNGNFAPRQRRNSSPAVQSGNQRGRDSSPAVQSGNQHGRRHIPSDADPDLSLPLEGVRRGEDSPDEKQTDQNPDPDTPRGGRKPDGSDRAPRDKRQGATTGDNRSRNPAERNRSASANRLRSCSDNRLGRSGVGASSLNCGSASKAPEGGKRQDSRPSTRGSNRPGAQETKVQKAVPNFVRLNAKAAREFSLRKSPSESALAPSEAAGDQQLRAHKHGQLPAYLQRRRERWRREEAARLSSIPDPDCPPGHTKLSQEDRLHTLGLLRQSEQAAIQQLNSLPLFNDSLRCRRLKEDLHQRLADIEDGIRIFSKSKVFIREDLPPAADGLD